MKYRFSGYDYLIFGLSYVFFFIFVGQEQAAFAMPVDLPSWTYLAIAVALNVWAIPLPGIHPRSFPEIEHIEAEPPEIPAEEEAPALPGKEPEALAVPEAPVEEIVPAGPTAEEKLAEGLTKTHKGFIDRISSVFKKSSVLDDDTLTELEETLVGTDIGIKTAYKLFEDVQEKAKDLDDPSKAMDIIKDEISGMLLQRQEPLVLDDGVKPYVIMVSGVNGSGKTTTIAKLARLLKNQGKSVIVAAGDTFRAAAIEQLEHWADKVGVDIIKSHEGADPSAVAFDGLQAAIARGHDVLIIDTAGRLHTKENLMEELKKTKRVLDKKMEGAPHEVLLVLDATIGQNAIEQTRQFDNALGVTGITLTKLDGSAKGGVIVGIANEFDIPVRFIGIGEGMDDLQPFEAKDFVDALFLDNQE